MMPSFIPPQDPVSHLSDVAVACPELLEQVRHGQEGGEKEEGREFGAEKSVLSRWYQHRHTHACRSIVIHHPP